MLSKKLQWVTETSGTEASMMSQTFSTQASYSSLVFSFHPASFVQTPADYLKMVRSETQCFCEALFSWNVDTFFQAT